MHRPAEMSGLLRGVPTRETTSTKGVKPMTQKTDIYTRVTNKIVTDLEKGEFTWLKP